ncbi:MAG: MFS transporter [Candidatus Solibacter sp.]|nr:MFS transporter [Candidatus Solibacter sp.]
MARMTSPPAIASTALSGKEWRVLILLIVSALINYIDRTTLSVAATDIQRELHLTNTQVGALQSAFFASYALCQLSFLAGWVVGRFHVGWVLACGFFLWSGATAITGAATVFAMIFVLRLLLGIGESVTFPSYSRILASEYPEHHRGFANALIDSGTKVGPALGILIGGLLVSQVGWRIFFVVLGGGSLLWLIPWAAWMPQGKGVASREDASEIPSIGAILRERSAWFTAFGLFCGNYYWYFLITWLPAYLEKERHFPKTKMALFGWLPFLGIAVSCVFSGWLSDRLIARGGSPTRVRKGFAATGLTFATILIPVVLVHDATLAQGLLMLACISYGIYTSNLWAITQSLAGPRAAGKWTSFQNGFGNLAGVLAPWLTGFVVDRTGEFYLAFVLAAGFALAGAAMFVFGVGPIEPVNFRRANPARATV